LSLQYTPFEIAERCANTSKRGPAPGCSPRRRWPSARISRICRAHRPARGAHAAHRQPVRLSRSGAHLSAAQHAGAAASGFAAKFIEACAPLLEASGGRAFLLYTSYRGWPRACAALKARFPEPPFPVLVQGEAPREALLNRFRELGNAVLLATGSFWEGVDVKGEALSIVAIDKLPFASPDDPLLKARLEGIRRRGGNPFFEYQLPQAVLALKQGVGRLIRDFDDFGVIVLGDPRLKTKAYGRVFLRRCRRAR
jgi:Rad3-related DNA helicase